MNLKELKLYAEQHERNKISMQKQIVNIFSNSCSVLHRFGRIAGSAACYFSLQ